MSLTIQHIQTHLEACQDPISHQNWISGKVIKKLEVSDKQIHIDACVSYPIQQQEQRIQQWLAQQIVAIAPQHHLSLSLSSRILTRRTKAGVEAVKGVRNIIAVASGKGGVGKSATSANLALALSYEGARVGLLDADIYGPSQPQMFGSYEAPTSQDKKTIEPVIRHGIQTMSIGYLVDKDTAMIWRGPMVSGALQQLLRDTQWQDLDYLIVDLPPGTGDIQLTLSQKVPVTAAVVVTTPQDLALLDARRAIKMFEKVSIPTLGIVENMSHFVCPHCQEPTAIFGNHGGQALADEIQTDLLGKVPLDMQIREDADSGTPSVACDPESPLSQNYRSIAMQIAGALTTLPKGYSGILPKTVVEQTASQ